jgi:hypothetical protein
VQQTSTRTLRPATRVTLSDSLHFPPPTCRPIIPSKTGPVV